MQKEALVVMLLDQGKTIRDIAKEVHMSFSDIGAIKRRTLEEPYNQTNKKLTKNTLAVELFSKGKSPLDVCIELDMDPQEIERLYSHYFTLKDLSELSVIILRDNLRDFLNFYESCRSQQIDNNTMHYILNNRRKISKLDSYLEMLQYEIRVKETRIQKENETLNFLHGQIEVAQSNNYKERQNLAQIKEEHYEIGLQLSSIKQMMYDIKNKDDYIDFESKLSEIFNNIVSKDVLNMPLIIVAFFEAVRKNPIRDQIFYSYYQRFQDDNIKEDLKLKQDYIFFKCMRLVQDFAEKLHQVYSNKAISDIYRPHNTKIFI